MCTLCEQNTSFLNTINSEVLNTTCSEGAQDMLLEGNPYKRALLKQDPAPCLTCSFLHKEMWKDVAVFPSMFFTWWLMLNIIYAQSLQESKDDISCQPCMTAYLSFVTIFNTIYQRKAGFQKPKNSQMLCICEMPMFKTERLAAMTEMSVLCHSKQHEHIQRASSPLSIQGSSTSYSNCPSQFLSPHLTPDPFNSTHSSDTRWNFFSPKKCPVGLKSEPLSHQFSSVTQSCPTLSDPT